LLIQRLKHIEISKGVVVYKGNTAIKAKKPKMPNGGGDNKNGIPKRTIQQVIENIEQKYQISKKDVLFIREECKEVSEIPEIKTTVNSGFLPVLITILAINSAKSINLCRFY
jgi:hypothetical protein